MALEALVDLTTAEEEFLRKNAQGEFPDYCVGSNERDDPANAHQWGPERTLRAECIRWLCMTMKARPLVLGNRIRAKGAKIKGVLQLDYATIDFVLAFSGCAFMDKITFEKATLRGLEFVLTHVKSIYAVGMEVSGSVHFWNGFVAVGNINLDLARISGDLRCDQSRLIYKLWPDDLSFTYDTREAFRAAKLEVHGLVSFCCATVHGGVSLYQSRIAGNLTFDGCVLNNKGRRALSATGATIGGAAYLARNFFAYGEVNLEFATIAGSLNCEGGRFINRSVKPTTDHAPSLNLESAAIGGSLYLTRWFGSSGRVHLNGVSIAGHLDCSGGYFLNAGSIALLANHAKITTAVLLRHHFYSAGEVRFFAAVVGGNFECSGRFSNSDGSALDAERINVTGHVLFDNLCTANGLVTFFSAKVGGNFTCEGTFSEPDGTALSGERINVSGHLQLQTTFKAHGTVSLIGAVIAGNLLCRGGQFKNLQKTALAADGARVDGSVFFDNKFEALGTVRLFAINIGLNLECQDAHFSNEGQETLFAAMAKVNGNVVLCNNFVSNGQVTLYGAQIRGSLVCGNGKFINEGKVALLAAAADIRDYVFLNAGFVSKGSVILDRIAIGSDLNCEGGCFSNFEDVALSAQAAKISNSALLCNGFRVEGAINLTRLEVKGSLNIFGVRGKNRITALSLANANVAILEHSTDSWPYTGRLILNGFVYRSLGFQFERKLCVEWLQLQPSDKLFSLQPYEQLADVLKLGGYESEATDVLIAKQEDLRRYGDLGWGAKLSNLVLGAIGHGYRPLKAFGGMLCFIVLGTILFQIGYINKLIKPSSSVFISRQGKMDSPQFQALVYSVDTFIPLLSLNEKSYWLINANGGANVIPGVRLGGLLRIYLLVHIIFGWALTTIWVAGFTGLVRRLK